MIYELDEVVELLSVSKNAIRMQEKKKSINAYLCRKGYELIDRFRMGKKVYYNLVTINTTITDFDKLCKFHRVDSNKFAKHIVARKDSLNKPISTKDIYKETKLSDNTTRKYDNILVEEKFMKKDFIYTRYICIEGKMVYDSPCTKEEYDTFWKRNSNDKKLKDAIRENYYRGNISYDEMLDAMESLTVSIIGHSGEFISRTKVYSPGENKIYDMLIDNINLNL